jgi:Zn-finger nucleic acid-binding protein
MTLLEGEGISLQRCAECEGIWVDSTDLNPILLRHALPVLGLIGGKANLEEIAVTCPECDVDLTVIEGNDRAGTRYDTCESCGGIWLDLEGLEDGENLEAIEAAVVDHYRAFKG